MRIKREVTTGKNSKKLLFELAPRELLAILAFIGAAAGILRAGDVAGAAKGSVQSIVSTAFASSQGAACSTPTTRGSRVPARPRSGR
jgi:hypothetical protein